MQAHTGILPARGLRGLRRVAIGLLALALAACTTFRGAPDSPFPSARLDGSDRALSLSPDDLQSLIDAASESDRNKLLRELLSDIDIRYLDFAGGVVMNKAHFDTTKNLLTLSAGVASSLTESAGVRGNYAALSALLSGGGAEVEANYLFGQTALALVATMDEQRAIVLADIRRSMSRSINEYSGQTALGDAIRYYRAGTLAHAATQLQKAAAARAEDEQENVRRIPIPTDEQVQAAVSQGRSFSQFVKDPANVEKVRAALIAVKAPGIDAGTSADDVRAAAFRYFQDVGPDGGADAFLQALGLPTS